jgi:hypothetical protein
MGTILTSRQVWAKSPQAEPRLSTDLAHSEAASLRFALLFLRTRLGGTAQLASALKVKRSTLDRYLAKGGKPSASVALRAARIADVDALALLDGRFPPEGACPHCGRL